MWRRSNPDEEAKTNAIKNRFATVLGLDLQNDKNGAASAPEHQSREEQLPSTRPATKTLANANSGLSSQKFDLQSSPAVVTPEPALVATQTPEITTDLHALTGILEPPETDCADRQLHADRTAIGTTLLVEEVPDRFSQKVEETPPERENHFGHTSTPEVVPNGKEISPALTMRAKGAPKAPGTPSLDVDTAVAELTRKSEELLDRQARLFEDTLTRIGNTTLSQAQASVHRTVSRLETYFAQAEEMKSTLEAILTRVSERAEDVAQRQASVLEEKVVRTSEQAISQAQENIRGQMANLAENAVRSFEEQISSLGKLMEARLKESFESSCKAQLDIMQQQAANFSEDLLNGFRKDSATVAHSLEELKSDTQRLEARVIEVMQGKFQKATEEIRSVLERVFK